MTTHSLAQEVIYEFFQDTEENTLHLSVRSKETGKPLSFQFKVTDAIAMFASLSQIIPKMKNQSVLRFFELRINMGNKIINEFITSVYLNH
jgi:hypothetical protein